MWITKQLIRGEKNRPNLLVSFGFKYIARPSYWETNIIFNHLFQFRAVFFICKSRYIVNIPASKPLLVPSRAMGLSLIGSCSPQNLGVFHMSCPLITFIHRCEGLKSENL